MKRSSSQGSLTSAFVKAVKAFRFHPPDNPTLKGLKDQLLRKFQFFLNKYPSFVIQVGEYDLSYKGKILYENRDVKTSLAFSLYKDGLREIRFMKNLEEWEVQGIIDILKQSEQVNPSEGDMVTMMWERDFVHIRYLATDEYLGGDAGSPPGYGRRNSEKIWSSNPLPTSWRQGVPRREWI